MKPFRRTPKASDSQRATEHGVSGVVARATDLRAGTTLAHYEIEELIGRGGMGVVYRAQHAHLRRTVALKLLGPDMAHDTAFRERFLRESRIAAAIHHPNIITIYDAGEADGLLYIAMRYIEGADLASVLERDGALAPERALSFLGQVADALDAAHALGIVHRDVKPANILMDADRCYLTDFGLTRRMSSRSGLTVQGQFVGTVEYMSPEQIEGGPLDGRTDVYALGCLLYHALAGTVPYARESEVSVIYAHMQERPPSLSAKRPDLPIELDAVVAKAMAKRKEDRYDRCRDLIDAAGASLGHQPAPGASTERRRPAKTRKVLVADDDPSVRAMVRVTLAGRAFEVIDASDGGTALALARNERPDIVLVAWSLTEPSGADVCRALRADDVTADAKILALTARADAVDEAEIRAAGADDHIRKPFPSAQLAFKAEAVLGEGLDGSSNLHREKGAA